MGVERAMEGWKGPGKGNEVHGELRRAMERVVRSSEGGGQRGPGSVGDQEVLKRARECYRWLGGLETQRVLERSRECYRGAWNMEKPSEGLRGPGWGGEGQGGVERTMEGSESQEGAERPGKLEESQGGLEKVIECWRDPGSVREVT